MYFQTSLCPINGLEFHNGTFNERLMSVVIEVSSCIVYIRICVLVSITVFITLFDRIKYRIVL